MTESELPGRPYLSAVVPVFNESESIVEFARQLKEVLEGIGRPYEVLFVDDGSTDGSSELIAALRWPEVRVLKFLVNAGHMAALDAGYRNARGEYVVSLDSDLQHPPGMIPEMLAAATSGGVDVVYAARESRTTDSWFKRVSAVSYYRLMRALTDLDLQNSAADFRLISDRVVRVIQALPQGRQVFRLLIPSLGFSHAVVYYTASERFGGTTKYTLRKMINLSTDSIIGFTTKPLTLSIRIGLAVSLLAVVGFVYVIITYFTGQALEGWASVLSTLLLMFGMLFVILGVFGLYLGAILRSSMARPTYILTEGTGRSAAPGPDGGNR